MRVWTLLFDVCPGVRPVISRYRQCPQSSVPSHKSDHQGPGCGQKRPRAETFATMVSALWRTRARADLALQCAPSICSRIILENKTKHGILSSIDSEYLSVNICSKHYFITRHKTHWHLTLRNEKIKCLTLNQSHRHCFINYLGINWSINCSFLLFCSAREPQSLQFLKDKWHPVTHHVRPRTGMPPVSWPPWLPRSRLEIIPQIYWSRPRPLFLTVLSPRPIRSHFLPPQKNITIEFRKIYIYQVNWVKVLLATLTTNFCGNQGWCWSDWAI